MEKINKKILIIEDDADFLNILKLKFSSEGIEIITAKNGEEGASAAENEKPDIVISDVLLPQMDGITMAKKIRGFNKDAQIIFLTNINLKDSEYEKDLKKLGNFKHWIKSDLKISDIVQKVKKLMLS